MRIGTLIPELQGVEKVSNLPPAVHATIAGLLMRAAADENHHSLMDSFTDMLRGLFRK